MSTNCLKTQLKETVQNDSINVLGSIAISFEADSGEFEYKSRSIRLVFSQPTTIKVEGGTFTDINGVSLGSNTASYAANEDKSVYVSNNKCKVIIPKYYISLLTSSYQYPKKTLNFQHLDLISHYVGNSSTVELDYLNAYGSTTGVKFNCRTFKAPGCSISGDVSGIKQTDTNGGVIYFPAGNLYGKLNVANPSHVIIGSTKIELDITSLGNNLVSLQSYGNSNVTGDVSHLFKNISNTTCSHNIAYSCISGSLENAVETAWGLTKRQGTVVLVINEDGDSAITLSPNGTPVPVYGTYKFIFSESGVSITKNSVEIAAYRNSTWTYA